MPIVDESRQLDREPECPVCGKVLDGYTQVGGRGAVPKDGDITICVYCGAPLEFAGEGFKVMPEKEVAVLMASNYDFRRTRQAVLARIREQARDVREDRPT